MSEFLSSLICFQLFGHHRYPLAIELIANGKVDVKPLVTHRFHIDKAMEAFDLLKKAPKGVVKVIIHH